MGAGCRAPVWWVVLQCRCSERRLDIQERLLGLPTLTCMLATRVGSGDRSGDSGVCFVPACCTLCTSPCVSKVKDWGEVEEALPCPDLTTNLGKCELATFYLMLYGVCTACLCWLMLVVVHAAHVEDFQVRGLRIMPGLDREIGTRMGSWCVCMCVCVCGHRACCCDSDCRPSTAHSGKEVWRLCVWGGGGCG